MTNWMHEMRSQAMAANVAEIAHLLSMDDYMNYVASYLIRRSDGQKCPFF